MIVWKSGDKKMLFATGIGSMLEIFDFVSFVFLSSIIAELFFPQDLHGLNILFTYVTISVSYLLRPIGGVVMGSLGDRFGRKSVFLLSILLMSVPSFLISILPTYKQIGIAATVMLITLRVLQGFSLGGEVPGSITYIKEKFKDKNYFLCTAWLTFGANLGVFFAAKLIDFLTHHLKRGFMLELGFRIPFLLGGVLSVVGFYIRNSVTESEEFKVLQLNKKITHSPIKILMVNYKSNIVVGFVFALLVSVMTSLFHIILPNLLVNYFRCLLSQATEISLIGAGTIAIFSLFFAYITKYIKLTHILRFGIIGLILIFVLLFLKNSFIVSNFEYIVFFVSFFLAAINGLFFGILADLFPVNVRFSGVAVCYNLAYVIGAGITPLWSDVIVRVTHSFSIILIICIVVSIIALINTYSKKIKDVRV
jgi:MFS family permease